MPGPLRERRFASFFTGRLVSLLGSSMTPVALAFAVLDASRNSTGLGIVLAAHMIPLIVFVLVGGSIGDRFSRALVLRFSNYGSGITQLIVAVVLITGHYSLTFVAVMEFLERRTRRFHHAGVAWHRAATGGQGEHAAGPIHCWHRRATRAR